MEGDIALFLYVPGSRGFSSGHNVGYILMGINSKGQLPPGLLKQEAHRDASQYYKMDPYKDLILTHRHQTAPPTPPGTGLHAVGQTVPSLNPINLTQGEQQTANTGLGLSTTAGGSALQLHPGVTALVLTGGLPTRVTQVVSDGLP